MDSRVCIKYMVKFKKTGLYLGSRNEQTKFSFAQIFNQPPIIDEQHQDEIMIVELMIDEMNIKDSTKRLTYSPSVSVEPQ